MTDHRMPFQDPADRPEAWPRVDPAEVLARLGCDPTTIDEEEAATGVARSLVLACAHEDDEAIDLVLDGYLDEARDEGEALIRALLATARIAHRLSRFAERALSVDVDDVMAVDAEFNRITFEHTRAAVAAIVADAPAEDLDPEVDATRAAMVRDAYVRGALDGVELDPDERIDLELEALLREAEVEDGASCDLGDPNDVTPGGRTGH